MTCFKQLCLDVLWNGGVYVSMYVYSCARIQTQMHTLHDSVSTAVLVYTLSQD